MSGPSHGVEEGRSEVGVVEEKEGSEGVGGFSGGAVNAGDSSGAREGIFLENDDVQRAREMVCYITDVTS